MNAVMRDKCFARRMVRAGCVEAVGIVRARRMDSTRVPTNAERVSAWRKRSHAPGFGGYYVRPWKAKREPIADCPQPDSREIDPRNVVQSMPARAAAAHDSPPVAAARAGSNTPAINDESGWDEYIRDAMAGEFQPF